MSSTNRRKNFVLRQALASGLKRIKRHNLRATVLDRDKLTTLLHEWQKFQRTFGITNSLQQRALHCQCVEKHSAVEVQVQTWCFH
jgi:hypothetical protein